MTNACFSVTEFRCILSASKRGYFSVNLSFMEEKMVLFLRFRCFIHFFFCFTLSFRAFTRVASEQRSHCVASLLDNSPRSQ